MNDLESDAQITQRIAGGHNGGFLAFICPVMPQKTHVNGANQPRSYPRILLTIQTINPESATKADLCQLLDDLENYLNLAA